MGYPESVIGFSTKNAGDSIQPAHINDVQTEISSIENGLLNGTHHLTRAWPIGSVFIAFIATNPGTLLGFGVWVIFAAGRVLVGIDTGQAEFDTVEETGGAKTHTLTTAEIPSHTHVQDSHNHTQNAHNHTQDAHGHALYTPNAAGGVNQLATSGGDGTAGNNLGGAASIQNATATNQAATATNIATIATNQNTGGGGAHNNLQPYIVVYMWKRTS